MNGSNYQLMSDEDILVSLDNKKIAPYQLEKLLNDNDRAVKLR